MDDQIETEPLCRFITKRDHVAKLPGGVDMQQRKRKFCWIERLQREMQHHAGVLADRIEHDRRPELRDHVAHDLDRFGFESLEMSRQHARGLQHELHCRFDLHPESTAILYASAWSLLSYFDNAVPGNATPRQSRRAFDMS